MLHRAIATLREALCPHLGLSKDRAETLALIVVAMVSARTVNLSHLAAERLGSALVASTYRRLQRFFQYVRLGPDWAAPIAAELSGLWGSWYLALDRTQWRIGTREVNFLVLAAVTRRFRVPLLWTVIPGRGNSSRRQRIALMRRYLIRSLAERDSFRLPPNTMGMAPSSLWMPACTGASAPRCLPVGSALVKTTGATA
jgi:hypothetical protein